MATDSDCITDEYNVTYIHSVQAEVNADDGEGFHDVSDAFPLDPAENVDTD